jgi:hypothetical protein
MVELGKLVEKVRSKNAGPFWLTIDIFCGNAEAFDAVVLALPTERIAVLTGAEVSRIKRFDIKSLNVVKFTLPRPMVQGSIGERDMHGASWAALISELKL